MIPDANPDQSRVGWIYNRTELVRKEEGFRGIEDFEFDDFFERGTVSEWRRGIRRIGRGASIVENIKFRRDQRRAEAMNSSFSKAILILAQSIIIHFTHYQRRIPINLRFASWKTTIFALDHSKFALKDLSPPSSNPAVLSLLHARSPCPLAPHRAHRIPSPRSRLLLIPILLIVDVHKVWLREEDPVIVEAFLRCELRLILRNGRGVLPSRRFWWHF